MGKATLSWDSAEARNSASVSKDSGPPGRSIGNPASSQAWPPARGSAVSREEQNGGHQQSLSQGPRNYLCAPLSSAHRVAFLTTSKHTQFILLVFM